MYQESTTPGGLDEPYSARSAVGADWPMWRCSTRPFPMRLAAYSASSAALTRSSAVAGPEIAGDQADAAGHRVSAASTSSSLAAATAVLFRSVSGRRAANSSPINGSRSVRYCTRTDTGVIVSLCE